MRRPTLIQAISQFALLSVALAAHGRKGNGIRKLSGYHYDSTPQCMVDCIYRMDRSDLPHCTPDKFYGRFEINDFIRDQDVADCFCRDLFFLKDFSECIIQTCNRPSQFYRAAEWGYNHCAARGVNLLNPQDIPRIPKSMDFFKNWDPEHWVPPVWIPEDTTSATTTVTSTTATATSTSTVTSTATSTTVSTTTRSFNNTTITTRTINNNSVIAAPTSILTIVSTATMTAAQIAVTATPTTVTATPTTVTAMPTTVTATPPHTGVAKATDEVTVEVGLQSFSGPSCVGRCYQNPAKAGWFTDAKYKEDVHHSCKSIYDKYVASGMNTNGWSDDDQRKLSRCVCTHKSYVKAMVECGLKECSSSNGEAQQAVFFGYQVCSKKGMIEFPYVDIMIEKLQATIPGNISLPDRVGLASQGVGGAPTFPILDEDGDKMMFPSGAERITNILETNSLFVSYAIVTLLFIVFW